MKRSWIINTLGTLALLLPCLAFSPSPAQAQNMPIVNCPMQAYPGNTYYQNGYNNNYGGYGYSDWRERERQRHLEEERERHRAWERERREREERERRHREWEREHHWR